MNIVQILEYMCPTKAMSSRPGPDDLLVEGHNLNVPLRTASAVFTSFGPRARLT